MSSGALDLDKLAAAKLWLVSAPNPAAVLASPAESPRDLAYLAHALYALIPVASDDVPRATCDERWRIYLNPGWLAAASVPETGRELAHLVWHLLADHADRARDQDVDRSTAAPWKRAADATVSHTLDPDELRPPHLARAADFTARDGLSAEEYFAMLSGLPASSADDPAGEPGTGCGSGADGIPRSHEHAPSADLGEVTAADAREIRRQVAIEYREHTTRRGTDPGDALRWVREILEPEQPWTAILSGAVRRAVGWAAGRGEYTYTRPSRRASAVRGVVLPGQRRIVPRVSFVVDTSASVDDGLLAKALGEVDGVIAALGVPGAQVTVHSVDAAAHTVRNVTRIRDVALIGAGGTDLRVGLRAVEAERPRPDLVVVFTDGDTPWPQAPPAGSAVVIALLGRRRELLPPTPSWAFRVECLVDD